MESEDKDTFELPDMKNAKEDVVKGVEVAKTELFSILSSTNVLALSLIHI